MALNIKNAEVEKLAAEVARLTHESKTEAIRVALAERVSRLRFRTSGQSRQQKVERALAAFARKFPKGEFGRTVTKAEVENILGYGPDGV
ncbi:MAG: type II toxin-antitoxin system VapB family antitoxin [Bryobacteraceae bacterium]